MARRPLTRAWQSDASDSYDFSAESASRLNVLVNRHAPTQPIRGYAADPPSAAHEASGAYARAGAAAKAHGLRVEVDILRAAIAAAEQDVAAEVTPRVVLGWVRALQARAAPRPSQ